jgi:hypothetical protein
MGEDVGMVESALTQTELKFLEKVERGQVFSARSYTAKQGANVRFGGGLPTAQKMARRGLINMPSTPDFGRPTYATLTDAGRAARAPKGRG